MLKKKVHRIEDGLRAEFNRHVPKEYLPLIEAAKGSAANKPLFLKTEQPVSDIYLSYLSHPAGKEEKATLRKLMRSRDFIDLGCGNPKKSRIPELAKELGAKRYIGIDLFIPQNAFPKKTSDTFQRAYLGNEDLLQFLSTIPDNHNSKKFLFISGIHTSFGKKGKSKLGSYLASKKYHDALYEELRRVTKPGDAILLGYYSFSIESRELAKRGFKKVKNKSGCRIMVKG